MAKIVKSCAHCRLSYAEFMARAKSQWSGLQRVVTACVACEHGTDKPVAQSMASAGTEAWIRCLDEALHSAKAGGHGRESLSPRGDSDSWTPEKSPSALHLIWQKAYECGNAVIDGEHRQIFRLANAAMDASFARVAAPDAFYAAFDALIAHVVQHFAHEEALLEQHGYARLRLHKAAHAHLLTKGRALIAGARADTVTLGDLVDFIANDIAARHLFTMDRDFFPLFGPR